MSQLSSEMALFTVEEVLAGIDHKYLGGEIR